MDDSSSRDHHQEEGGFRNPWPSFSFKPSLTDVFSMMKGFDRKRCAVTDEVRRHLGIPIATNIDLLKRPPRGLLQTTWVGHATFFIQFDRFNVLTDPIWSDRCSPLSFIGPKRFVPVPFPLEKLPAPDIVVISHNHYDHLDEKTITQLGNNPLYLVPLGLKSWFSGRGINNVVELDWWQEHKVSITDNEGTKTIKAICTPCQHFSGRGILDRNKTLWCSWVLEGETKKVFFAGDTGFCTVSRESQHPGGVPVSDSFSVCSAFEKIGKRYGPFDAAYIPIGAYDPRYFMSAVHCSPEDAVAIHKAVGSKKSVAMHWGTFTLTDEPILEPPLRLNKELQRLGIDLSCFIVMKHGETQTW